MPDMDGEGVRNADLIIEAVPEKLELKQKVYAGLEPKMKPGAILATNTSSIPLQDLRTTLQKPERLLGLHFFNPVSRLQLVEVVSHDGTDAQLLKEALAFVGAIDRLPLPVKSLAGLPRQPRADALHAGGDGDAGREDRQGRHRCRGEEVRHADGADRTRRSGRPRYLPRCRRHAALEIRRRAAADAGLAARKGRQAANSAARPARAFISGRTARRTSRAASTAIAGADGGNDRPADPADVECLRRLLARGHRRQCRRGRRRHDLRHRLRAVPRRSAELCAHARRRRTWSRPCARWRDKFGDRFTPDAGWENFK